MQHPLKPEPPTFLEAAVHFTAGIRWLKAQPGYRRDYLKMLQELQVLAEGEKSNEVQSEVQESTTKNDPVEPVISLLLNDIFDVKVNKLSDEQNFS